MCDYCLHHVASRPAKVGDELVSTEFAGSYSRGFAKEVEYERGFPLLWTTRRIVEEVAQFQRVNASQPEAHHDALQFPSGQIVLVTRLCPGQIATVLQLPASEVNAKLAPVEEERSVLRI
jgi:hypothetical protein